MRCLPPLLLLLLALPSAPLHGQWQWNLVAGSARSAGHARADADPERPEVGPDRPSTLALGVVRRLGAWQLGASLLRATADLAIRGSESAVLTRGGLTAWGAGMEIGRLVAGRTGAPTLSALAGGAIEQWRFPVSGGDPRTVVMARAALEGQVPLRAHWRGIVRWEVAVGGSLFGADELPPGYAVRAGRRWGLGLGVGWTP